MKGLMPVLEAADRKAVCLIVGVAVDRRVAGIQFAVPSVRARWKRRPNVGVARQIVERPIGIAVAS